MNIYLLERTDKWSYDDYDATVVIAENEEDAKKIEITYHSVIRWSWTTPNNIKATLIGTAMPDAKSGVVLKSFNAG